MGWVGWAVAVVAGVVAAVSYPVARDTLRTGIALTAKLSCAALFLQDRPLAELQAEELSAALPLLMGLEVVNEPGAGATPPRRQVTVRFLGGIARRTAVFVGPHLGCLLLDLGDDPKHDRLLRALQGSERQLAARHTAHQADASTGARAWPSGPVMDEGRVAAARARVDGAALRAVADAEFQNRSLHCRALLVLVGGHPVLEAYDSEYHPSDPHATTTVDTPLLGWSLSKSILSALVGRRVQEGKIRLDSRIDAPEWLPYTGTEDPRRALTVRHLLNMNSGLAWSEAYSVRSDPAAMQFLARDAARFAAEGRNVTPGRPWAYSSGTSTILARRLRASFAGDDAGYWAYPRDSLFSALGMESAVLELDPAGTHMASSWSYATARDWARFGLLYLWQGRWPVQPRVAAGSGFDAASHAEWEQVLPDGWYNLTTSPVPASGGVYGAHFWLGGNRSMGPVVKPARWLLHMPEDLVCGLGFEEQFVCAVPSLDLVVVRLGWTQHHLRWPALDFMQGILDAIAAKRSQA